MLPDCIYQLMDLPNVGYEDLAITEFNHKYNNTWLIINDKFYFIEKLNREFLTTSEEVIKNSNIKTIKNYTPKSGLYAINDELLVYCLKLNQKQWSKSFSIGKTYNIIVLRGGIPWKAKNFINAKYLGNITIFDNEIYFFYTKIAVIVDKVVYPIEQKNPFKSEIEELWTQLEQPYPLIWGEQKNLLKPGPIRKNTISKMILENPMANQPIQVDF